MTTSKHTVTVEVMDYATGEKLGDLEIGLIHADQYAAKISTRYQWPEGIAKLKDVVDHDCEIADLGGDGNRVVYLEF